MAGNTTGKVVGETGKGESAQAANPALKVETPKEKSWWGKWGDAIHEGLDLAGNIPVVGIVADAANAGIYAAEGNYVQAAISGVSAAANFIPGGGLVTHGGKALGKAALKAGEKEAAKVVEKEAAKQLEKEAAEAAAKKLATEKAEKEAAEKLAKEKTEKEAGKKQTDTKIKKQTPHKDCGKLGKYSQAPKGRGAADLEADHTPSGAALERAMRNKLKEMGIKNLKPKQIDSIAESLKRQAPTITIPKDVHAEGNTYKANNTDARITADSKDLKGAAKRDTAAIQKSMDGKDHGCSEAYKAAAKKLIEETDFDKLIKNAIDGGLKRFGK
jgi:hypothetical protein